MNNNQLIKIINLFIYILIITLISLIIYNFYVIYKFNNKNTQPSSDSIKVSPIHLNDSIFRNY
jgi:Na+/melibiose symporter-like transporter